MAYLKIDGTDFSHCVNSLKINQSANYNSQTNAAGDTVVDYINNKRTIEVGIIPLDSADMKILQAALVKFNLSIEYRDAYTGELKTVNCILPSNGVDYYTIQSNKVLYKAFTLKFIEL